VCYCVTPVTVQMKYHDSRRWLIWWVGRKDMLHQCSGAMSMILYRSFISQIGVALLFLPSSSASFLGWTHTAEATVLVCESLSVRFVRVTFGIWNACKHLNSSSRRRRSERRARARRARVDAQPESPQLGGGEAGDEGTCRCSPGPHSGAKQWVRSRTNIFTFSIKLVSLADFSFFCQLLQYWPYWRN
jgi:hypothetical protein